MRSQRKLQEENESGGDGEAWVEEEERGIKVEAPSPQAAGNRLTGFCGGRIVKIIKCVYIV